MHNGLGLAFKVRRQKKPKGFHVGPLIGAHPGRTDTRKIKVPAGAYVINADTVSHVGQNNTLAGLSVLDRMFGKSGPYGSRLPKMAHGKGTPKPPKVRAFRADGGAAPVDIIAADGEYVIEPEIVEVIGGGDLAKGHKLLDEWMQQMRKDHIKTLKKLPGPAKT